jgi:hypothetical protein
MTSARSQTVDLRSPRSTAEIVSAAVRCYLRYPLLFAALALMVVLPYALIVLAVNGSTLLTAGHGSTATQLTLTLLEFLVVTPLISALHIHALVELGDGHAPQLVAVARRGLRVLPVVAAAEIVAGIGTFLGLLLLIIPGVILSLRWSVVAQAAAVERVDWPGALRRSGELTKRNYIHVLGLLFIVGVVDVALTRAGSSLAGSGAHPLGVLLGVAIETITRSFAALTTAFLFFDLLARHRDANVPA